MLTPENQRLLAKYKSLHIPTNAEISFEKFLNLHNIHYKSQKGFMVDTMRRFYIADFYLPKPFKIALEIDGPYHLNTKYYDFERDNYFKHKRRINVIRITNQQAFDYRYLTNLFRSLFIII